MPTVICNLEIASAIAALSRLSKVALDVEPFRMAVGMAAFTGERQVKLSATRLIYALPERGYKRTGTLRRAITAASPDYDHGGDEATAHTGDVSPGAGSSLAVARVRGRSIESEVGCWVRYARYVNDGTRFRDPTHFFEDGLSGLEAELERYVLVAISQVMADIL